MPKRTTALCATILSSILLVGSASPASAATWTRYGVDDWTTAGPASDRSDCQWSGVQETQYEFGWNSYGDGTFLRDCLADGWGVVVEVSYRSGEEWRFVGTQTDPSAAGDGGWKAFGHRIPEGAEVELVVHQYSAASDPDVKNAIRCKGFWTSGSTLPRCPRPSDPAVGG